MCIKLGNSKTNHKDLRISLAYSLCQPLLDMPVAGNRRSSYPSPGRPLADLSRLKRKHFASGAKKGGKRGRCKVCGSKKTNERKKKDTKLQTSACSVMSSYAKEHVSLIITSRLAKL